MEVGVLRFAGVVLDEGGVEGVVFVEEIGVMVAGEVVLAESLSVMSITS